MSERVAFLWPVVIDDTSDAAADVPDKFREVQWTQLRDAIAAPAFVDRVRRLLQPSSDRRDSESAAGANHRSMAASRSVTPFSIENHAPTNALLKEPKQWF